MTIDGFLPIWPQIKKKRIELLYGLKSIRVLEVTIVDTEIEAMSNSRGDSFLFTECNKKLCLRHVKAINYPKKPIPIFLKTYRLESTGKG